MRSQSQRARKEGLERFTNLAAESGDGTSAANALDEQEPAVDAAVKHGL